MRGMALHPSVCPLDCPDACGVLVETDAQGAFERVRGNPDHPWSRGSLCSKTAAYGDIVTAENRILFPQIRNAAGVLERATWDEAIARIVERVEPCGYNDILALSYAGNMGQIARKFPNRMMNALGAAFADGGICDATAEAGFESVLGAAYGPRPGALDEADAVVVWGCDPRRTMPHFFSRLKDFCKRGVPVWVIDIYRTDTIDAVERWGGKSLILKPGSDAALALGLCDRAFEDGDADSDFLRDECEGAMQLRIRTAGNWGMLRIVKETGLDAALVHAFIADVHEAKKPYLKFGIGFARRRNGGMSMRAVCSWAAVLGHADRVHFQTGAYFGEHPRGLEGSDLRPLDAENLVIRHVSLGTELEKHAFPVIFVWGHNPAATVPDSQRVREQLARKDRFLVVHELMPTETVALADVVLPATAFPEHSDVLRSYGHRVLQVARKAVEPRGEARSNVDAFSAIAKALGLPSETWEETEDELVDDYVRRSRERLGDGDAERLLAGEMVVPAYPETLRRKTSHEKIELYDAREADAGRSGVADYVPDDGAHGLGQFQLISAPSIATHNSTYTSSERHRARAAGARVFVNPDDASELQLKSGDALCLSNEQGALTLPTELDARMPRGLVRIDGFPLESEIPEGIGINVLVPGDPSDLGDGSSLYSTRVDLTRVD
tara:strand:- start:9309 stop:11312 length:2004 start_codon:yes stop_codon:yes gene_type:complete